MIILRLNEGMLFPPSGFLSGGFCFSKNKPALRPLSLGAVGGGGGMVRDDKPKKIPSDGDGVAIPK